MARLMKHHRSESYKLEQGGQTKWVCGCGLSKNKPLCDGSHKKAHDEESGAMYVYDAQGRVKLPAEY